MRGAEGALPHEPGRGAADRRLDERDLQGLVAAHSAQAQDEEGESEGQQAAEVDGLAQAGLLLRGLPPPEMNAAGLWTLAWKNLGRNKRRTLITVASVSAGLACLMFALELQRRSEASGWGIQSIASHPGISRTDLLSNGAGQWSAAGIARHLLWFLFQPAAVPVDPVGIQE